MSVRRPLLGLALAALLASGPALRAQDKGPQPPAGGLGGGGGLGGDAGGKGNDGKPPNDQSAALPVRVNQAIDSGVAWLKKQTFVKGNFADQVLGTRLYDPNSKGDPFIHPTGCTSLSLYTLLKCGVPKDDPVIQKAFAWMKTGSSNMTTGHVNMHINRVPGGTYEIAALILALEAKANPHKREAEREKDVKFRLKRGEKLKTG